MIIKSDADMIFYAFVSVYFIPMITIPSFSEFQHLSRAASEDAPIAAVLILILPHDVRYASCPAQRCYPLLGLPGPRVCPAVSS
ncbi:hypothetical protein TNIN_57451 [Trichonephila inaurata madagascariensis]|uniref:Uncharacterized protein n=1 Tax=Trichonephila inaurata madagascariensis TaxID=2747483 RepID=A0A8X7CHD8_9ARAC|nr:hypothetical protein TNIN_57451 [Trichonephila inaurata madagascariensis]